MGNSIYRTSQKSFEFYIIGAEPTDKIYDLYGLTNAYIFFDDQLFKLPKETTYDDIGFGNEIVDFNDSYILPILLIIASLAIVYRGEKIGLLVLAFGIYSLLKALPPDYPEYNTSETFSSKLRLMIPQLNNENFQVINNRLSVNVIDNGGLRYEHGIVDGLFETHTHNTDVVAIALTDGLQFTAGGRTMTWAKDMVVRIPKNVPHSVSGKGEFLSASKGGEEIAAGARIL